jgi:hypothetical protein
MMIYKYNLVHLGSIVNQMQLRTAMNLVIEAVEVAVAVKVVEAVEVVEVAVAVKVVEVAVAVKVVEVAVAVEMVMTLKMVVQAYKKRAKLKVESQ